MVILFVFILVYVIVFFCSARNKTEPFYSFCRNHIVLMILAILVIVEAILFVIMINEQYKEGGGYITMWGAKEMLAFYGSVLSLTGTLFLGFIAYYQNKQANEFNKRLAKRQLDLLGYNAQLDKLEKIRVALKTVPQCTNTLIIKNAMEFSTIGEIEALLPKLHEAQTNIEKCRVELDFIREFSIDPEFLKQTETGNGYRWGDVSNKLIMKLIKFREMTYNYTTDFYDVTEKIIQNIAKLKQYEQCERENEQYNLMLKSYIQDGEHDSERLVQLKILYVMTNNEYFLTEYKRRASEIEKNVMQRKEAVELIDALRKQNEKFKYSTTDYKEDILEMGEKIGEVRSNYEKLKVEAVNCQNAVEEELHEVRAQLMNLQ